MIISRIKSKLYREVVNIGIIIIRIICYKVAYLPLTNSKLSKDFRNISYYINAKISLFLIG